MNRKLLRTPTIEWGFLRTRSLVTLRSQHAGPRKCPISSIPLPSLQLMLLILSGFVRNIWIDPCVPASKGDPKLREE